MNSPSESGANALAAEERMAATSDRFLRRFVDVWIVIAVVLLAFQTFQAPHIQYPGLLMLGAGLPARLAMRSGRLQLARYVFIVPLALGVVVAPFFVNGVRTLVIANMPMILLLAGWMLGRRAMAILAGVFLLSVTLYWWSEALGWFAPAIDFRTPEIWWTVWAFNILITCATLWHLIGGTVTIHARELDVNRRLVSASMFNKVILLGSPLPMAVFAASGQCVAINDAYSALVGMTRETLLSQNFHRIAAWRTSGMLDECLIALQSRRPQQREIHVVTSLKKELWLDCRIVPIEIDGDHHVLIQLVDLTERKRSEKALADSERKFRSLAELGSDWYWEQDAQLRYVAASAGGRFHDTVGSSRDFGKPRWELDGVEVAGDIWDEHKARLAAHLPFRDFVYRRHNSVGELAFVSTSGDPVFSVDGRFTGYQGVAKDVTAHFQILETLRQTQLRFESIVSTAMDAVVTVDENDKIVLFNNAAERIFGYRADELQGHSLDVLIPAELRAGHARHLLAFSLAPGEQRSMAPLRVVYGVRKDGTRFPVEASISSVNFSSGRLKTAILRDVTERLAAENALKDLNESLDQRVRLRTAELESANRELEAFSYSVSHDLRAPLRAIGGFTGLIKDELGKDAGPDITHYLQTIIGSADRMSRLIDDVLEFGRIGKSAFIRTETDLGRVVDEIVADLQMQYPRTSFQVDRPGLANCDATMVRQIMGNLIGNACKYSAMREAPLVEVGWRMRAQTREYFVRDNGMGFDMAHASHLYEVFHRLHADSKIPGNGVGLAIVKRLIDRHNGHIEAESSVGAGACFRFTLDQDPAYSKMPDRS